MMLNEKDKENFIKLYNDYSEMHPDGSTLPDYKFFYLHRQWFMPHHIDLVLRNVVKFQAKYYSNANLTVCLFAALVHDAGLVYKRGRGGPEGHENRSAEYASMKLKELGYDDEFINKVVNCINATEPETAPNADEELLVRNADAYSHITSIHFFAKAYFQSDWYSYFEWFEKKINKTYAKLTIKELQDEVKPLIDFYNGMINTYKIQNESSFVKDL